MASATSNLSLVHSGGVNFPLAVGEAAYRVDALYFFIYFLSAVTFFGIVGALIYFVIKFRRRPDHQIALNQMTHSTALEIAWTVIPLILVSIIFVWGYTAYLKNIVPSSDAKEMRAIGRKWSWTFEDPTTGLRTNNELVVPLHQPIRLIMSSEDVIHSLFIPNLRVKQDVLPNHYTTLAFTADRAGRYQIFCTEFCGDGHARMLANLVVLDDADYVKWQADQKAASSATLPLNELGKKVSTDQGCFSCHSVDGSKSIGPSWKGIYGANRQLVGGKSAKADDNYLRRAIVDPAAEITAGYAPMMPTYAGKLSDQEMAGIIEYIRTIK